MATPVPEGAAYLTEQVELIVNNSVIDEVTSTSFPFSTFNSWESSPSYLQFLIGSFNYFYDSFLNIFFPTSSSSPSTSKSASASPGFISRIILDTELCLQNLSFNDVNLIIALSLFWAILRYLTTKHIFKPFASGYKLRKEDGIKVPESGWKLLFYSISWISVAYVLLIQEDGIYLLKPSTLWNGYSISENISTSIYLIHMVQTSFYVHATYTVLFEDSWRKDSLVMIAHHIITITLLMFSLAARYHRPGLITIFLHDFCDIILESTKICNYLTKQSNQIVKKYERAADLGFFTFAFTWFMARLYLFPLRLIYYSSVHLQFNNELNVPFGLFLNSLLYILLGMNIYWFGIIINIMYKVIKGENLEDSREKDEYEDNDSNEVGDENDAKKVN